MNKVLTYAIMLDFLIVAYAQLVIMLIELKKLISFWITLNDNNLKQGVFVCVARLPLSYRNEPYRKLWMWVSYIFIALEINKYVV
jgi:hypothetical protein